MLPSYVVAILHEFICKVCVEVMFLILKEIWLEYYASKRSEIILKM
jgi:hypothetical protein